MRACAVVALLMLAEVPQEPSSANPMPSEEQVRAVRAAWIAERLRHLDDARRLFTEASATWPDDPYVMDEMLRFLERSGGDAALMERLRTRLDAALTDPGQSLPLPLVRRRLSDRAVEPAELESLRTALALRLAREPGNAGLLEATATAQRRLQDEAGLAQTLDRLATVRPSAALDWERLILAKRAGRWTDAKALLDRIDKAGDRPDLARRMRLPIVAHLQGIDACLAAVGTPDPAERTMLAQTLLDIGWEQWDEGNDEAAEKAFRKARALAPEDRMAHQVVAFLFADGKGGAPALVSDDPAELLNEGTRLLMAEDAAGAYDLLRRASTALPREPSAWFNLGLAARQLERFDEAATALQRALALRPEWPAAMRALADAQARGGSCADAVATARRAIEADRQNPHPHATLFYCHQMMGDEEAARAAKAEYERLKTSEGR